MQSDIFAIVGKFQSHSQNSDQCLCYTTLLQIVTCNMKYFWISGFVYTICQKYRTTLAFRMSMLARLKNINLIKYLPPVSKWCLLSLLQFTELYWALYFTLYFVLGCFYNERNYEIQVVFGTVMYQYMGQIV